MRNTEAVRIKVGGNVGIGTTTPAAKLTVAGGDILIDNNSVIRSRDSARTIRHLMSLSSSNNIQIGGTSGTVAGSILMLADTDIRFSPGSAAGANETVRFAASGNVGIGTTNPTYKLDVSGLGRFTGLVDAANFIATSTSVASLFNGGFLSLASSTIGNGTAAGGLTVSGGATTTGNAYFAGNLRVATTSQDYTLTIGGTTGFGSSAFLLGGNGLGLNNTANDNYGAIYNPGGSGSSAIQFDTDVAAVLHLGTTGNVGIGTTTPFAKLSLTNTGTGPSFVVEDSTSPDTTPFIIDASGNVGIGTTSPGALLDAHEATANGSGIRTTNNSAAGTSKFTMLTQMGGGGSGISSWANAGVLEARANGGLALSALAGDLRLQTGASRLDRLTILNTGNVGIGTTSPWRKLSVTGTVGFDGLTANFGSGSLCLTANKEVVYNDASENCTSSLRATKHDINPLVVDALSQVLALQPVSFIYNEGNGRTRFGFIAEDTAAVDPHLTTYSAAGALTGIDDRAILSIVVRAIRDIASITGAFKANLIAWLAEAENGIENLFAKNLYAENITAHRVTADELCAKDDAGVPVCVTGMQLRSLLSGSVLGASASSNDNDPPANAQPAAVEPTDAIDPTASSTPPLAADAKTSSPANDNEASPPLPATEPSSAAQ